MMADDSRNMQHVLFVQVVVWQQDYNSLHRINGIKIMQNDVYCLGQVRPFAGDNLNAAERIFTKCGGGLHMKSDAHRFCVLVNILRLSRQTAACQVTWHVTTATVRSESCVQEYKAQSVENCNFMWLLNGFESWRLIKTVFGNGAERKVFDLRGRLEKTAQQGASWSVLVTFSDEIEQDVMGGAWS